MHGVIRHGARVKDSEDAQGSSESVAYALKEKQGETFKTIRYVWTQSVRDIYI